MDSTICMLLGAAGFFFVLLVVLSALHGVERHVRTLAQIERVRAAHEGMTFDKQGRVLNPDGSPMK